MRALIEEYQNGEESQLDFCNRVGINIHCFRYWLNQFRKDSQEENGFVRITGEAMMLSGDIELRFPNGVRLGLGLHPNAELVAKLIRLW